MIDCGAVGEGCSCFGCRLVGMTAMVSSIFEKMRLAGSAIYNGDILLLGFSSFAFLNYEIDDTYRKVHPDLLSCHFCSISMSFYLSFFFLNVMDITKALPPLFHSFPFFPFEK